MAFENKSFYILCPSFLHCLLLLFLLVLPTYSSSQPYKNVTLGSSLTATQQTNDSYWVSQSGDFAFGFLPLGSKGFLLAIWFDKIDEKTVVWSANRDKLVPKGSTTQFTNNGQLVLNDPGGNQIWMVSSSVSTNRSVSYAAMLDSGNFVLVATNSEILWQSFDVPTDTILPSQILNMGEALVARYSETNYSSGRFQLLMQIDGNLVLSPHSFSLDTINIVYWTSNTTGSGFQLVFNLTGSINVLAKNKTILTTVVSNAHSPQNYYLRAILEHDAIFRLYVYPKATSNSSMPKTWTQVSDPVNICIMVNDGIGSGVCGFNSYCKFGDDKRRPLCTCPPSYVLLDPNDEIKGCKPNFVAQSCDQSFPETDDFEFVALENTNWAQGDYSYFNPVSEEWCRNDCLNDCFCVLSTFKYGECWKKRFPLIFGRMDRNVSDEKSLLKVRKHNSTSKSNNLVQNQSNKTSIIVVIGSVLLGSSVFLNFLLFLLTLFIAYHFSQRKPKIIRKNPFILGVNMRIFSYEELNKATSGFIHQLECSSFATVYKGIIDFGNNNSLVAIKRFNNVVGGRDQEFKVEVSTIARTNHKNLVRLLGFCNEGEHRMLVYEFMHNGSLLNFLFGNSKPNWCVRIQVALETARGLCYLHEGCSTQIIHCDIKPHNILLDDSFTVRIADFGLAKLLRKNQTLALTAIRGTKGYVAPEWFRSLPITVKVDVYSFGILLLEIICCRRNFEEKANDEEQMVLADWAYDCFKDGKVELLVENDEEAKMDLKRVKKFVMIAIWCIQEEPSLRPTMKKVLQMMEGAIEISFPPHPSSFISSIS
ncbi:G-type lectin S-receptor-like serine/threonine-protein kinase LECRK3 [Benincasa hispida]|uniref:G-type lectin S-receptor-like serine/threonine-protein kinase LECRK3 n=1 Tax=Benincasa hispida TaxID=102211 RepID=UPI001901D1D9|nr:G-type lectin S-receptor-like serine/threonine-protein kinase LECRK3 [Benincasa hispida]